MNSSLPSREVYAIDVPEVKLLTVNFHYNFFTPDESINESGIIPNSAATKRPDSSDASFTQYTTTRVPRFIQFNFSSVGVGDQRERNARDKTFATQGEQNGSLISDNLDKIVNEGSFSSNGFVSVNFHDGEIDSKIFALVSGSMAQQMSEKDQSSDTSHYMSAQRYSQTLPQNIMPHFVFRALTLAQQSCGTTFFAPSQVSNAIGTRGGAIAARTGVPVPNNFFDRLKDISTNTQISSKCLHGMVDKTLRDPTAPSAGELATMYEYSKTAQAASQQFSTAMSEQDYKTTIPYISVQAAAASPHAQKYDAKVVGYIIDKIEILPDGSIKSHPPMIIENSRASGAIDYRVKYNATYCYSIRVIALFTMSAVDDVSGKLATLKALVSSKPSNKTYVQTIEHNAPPPPSDVNFVWNYETNKLMVHWTFPPNSQRDIKQFQIFRRNNVNESFELQKVYDFDDSVVSIPGNESPDLRLVEKLSSPVTFWFDDDFDPNLNNTLRGNASHRPPVSRDTGYIYSICCIDAHGFTSNYSAQFVVWFDLFKNHIQKQLISHSGAPKPYPNMYLEGDVFTDTIKASGPHSRKMKLYFNPEHYYLYDDEERITKVLSTKQVGGSYKLQFLNTDNGKGQDLNIMIDDQIPQRRSVT